MMIIKGRVTLTINIVNIERASIRAVDYDDDDNENG